MHEMVSSATGAYADPRFWEAWGLAGVSFGLGMIIIGWGLMRRSRGRYRQSSGERV